MRICLSILLLVSLFSCTAVKPMPDLTPLRQQIQAELATTPGTFAVAFKDMQTGQEILINERETFHAASTMKTPVLLEAYTQAAAGKFSLQDSIVLTNTFKSIVDGSPFTISAQDDSEQTLYRHLGQKWPIKDLLYKMIINSSNLATNLIIEELDARQVTQTMRQLGAKDIQILRGVEDGKAYRQGLNNTTTAYDLMLLFSQMAEGKTVSKNASQEMIEILLDQQHKNVIPAKLPQNVKVAHKTGWITGVRHDSGIVFLPDGGQYVLVLLSKDHTNDKAATNAMATVSALLYQHMTKKK